jgi:hypothetical protein
MACQPQSGAAEVAEPTGRGWCVCLERKVGRRFERRHLETDSCDERSPCHRCGGHSGWGGAPDPSTGRWPLGVSGRWCRSWRAAAAHDGDRCGRVVQGRRRPKNLFARHRERLGGQCGFDDAASQARHWAWTRRVNDKEWLVSVGFGCAAVVGGCGGVGGCFGRLRVNDKARLVRVVMSSDTHREPLAREVRWALSESDIPCGRRWPRRAATR